jgi:esterase/lipase
MDLASRVSDLTGLFSVCPPRRLEDHSLKGSMAREIWKRLINRVRGGNDRIDEFVENIPETPEISYLRNPVSGIETVEELMESLEETMPTLSQPILFVHTSKDPVASPSESRRIFDQIGSGDKSYVLLNISRHDILSGKGAGRVHRLIGDFIRQQTRPSE